MVDENKPVKTEGGLTLYELTDDCKSVLKIDDNVGIALSNNANIQGRADIEGHLVLATGPIDVSMLVMGAPAGSQVVFLYDGDIFCESNNIAKAPRIAARTRGSDSSMEVESGAIYTKTNDDDILLTLKTSVAEVKIISITISTAATVENSVVIAKTTNGDIISSKINAQAGEQVNLKASMPTARAFHWCSSKTPRKARLTSSSCRRRMSQSLPPSRRSSPTRLIRLIHLIYLLRPTHLIHLIRPIRLTRLTRPIRLTRRKFSIRPSEPSLRT